MWYNCNLQFAICAANMFWEIRLSIEKNPIVRRRQLGRQLRALRERAGLTLDDAAAQLEDFSAAKISRIETAKVGVRSRDVEALMDLYGLDDPHPRTNLLTLTRQSREHGWWEPLSDVMPVGEELAIGLEGEAVSIRIFSSYFVESLFQTEAYARELLQASWTSESALQINRRVNLRIERQKILQQQEVPQVRAVIDEAALRRPVGSYETLRSQLSRLTELAALPRFSIRVLPLSVGAHPGGEGSFRIIDVPPPSPAVVHFNHSSHTSYIEDEREIRLYSDIFARLESESLTAERSIELIRRLAQ